MHRPEPTPPPEPATGWVIIQGWRRLTRDLDGEYSTAPDRVAAPSVDLAKSIQADIARENIASAAALGWL